MVADPCPAGTKIQVALEVPFCAAEAADYLFCPDVIPYWLGSECQLVASLGSTACLPHARATGPPSRHIQYETPTIGKVVSLSWPAQMCAPIQAGTYEIVVELDGAPETSRVTMRISPRPDGNCRLRIQHAGLSDDSQRHASVKVWQGALRRVSRIMLKALHNLRHDRQAVIVVHGIGEQRPGQLLREFVANIFDRDAGEIHFVKPDHLSSLFEMRMATVPRSNSSRPTTDVY